MKLWTETSLKELYDAAVAAFPDTLMRHHATDPVRVEGLRWVPFEGVSTLLVRAVVRNEGRKNEPLILFKGVRYREGRGRGVVPIASSTGRDVYVEAISMSDNDALVRCTCKDFKWRFSHWNRLDGSLFGRGGRKYEAHVRPGGSNPEESPGVCKHLMKMAKILRESGVCEP